jgi:hypothetical protein
MQQDSSVQKIPRSGSERKRLALPYRGEECSRGKEAQREAAATAGRKKLV